MSTTFKLATASAKCRQLHVLSDNWTDRQRDRQRDTQMVRNINRHTE